MYILYIYAEKGKTLYHNTGVFAHLFALTMYMALVSISFISLQVLCLDMLQLYTISFSLAVF